MQSPITDCAGLDNAHDVVTQEDMSKYVQRVKEQAKLTSGQSSDILQSRSKPKGTSSKLIASHVSLSALSNPSAETGTSPVIQMAVEEGSNERFKPIEELPVFAPFEFDYIMKSLGVTNVLMHSPLHTIWAVDRQGRLTFIQGHGGYEENQFMKCVVPLPLGTPIDQCFVGPLENLVTLAQCVVAGTKV